MTIARFLVLIFVLCAVTITQSTPNAEVVDTSITYHTSTLTSEQIQRIPGRRTLEGIIQLAPTEVYPTNIASGSRITSTAQYIDGNEIQVLVRTDSNAQSSLQVCDFLDVNAICVQKMNVPGSIAFGAQYGGNSTAGVIALVVKSGGAAEFSQGIGFNPNTNNFKKSKFPLYYAPEKDFPLGVISSTGISADATASFQLVNFPRDSYMFFRDHNAKLKPAGQFTKISLGNVGFISSGTLSNRIDNLNGGPDFRFFGYRQYFNVGTNNLKSQVKLQVLNADTFQFIGNPFNYTPSIRSGFPIEEQSQSVRIEPGGAFMVYTKFNAAANLNLGYIRGISPTGAPQKQKLFTPVGRMRETLFGINSLDVIPVTPDISPEPD